MTRVPVFFIITRHAGIVRCSAEVAREFLQLAATAPATVEGCSLLQLDWPVE